MKCLKRVKKVINLKAFLFSSNKSLDFFIVNKIYSNYIVFNNSVTAKTYKTILENAGFNLSYPIYKLEFLSSNNFNKPLTNKQKKINALKHNSNKNQVDQNLYLLQQIYKTLTCINRLRCRGVQANFLIFITEQNYKNVQKLVKYTNTKNVKIYVTKDVDYKLLGAINYFNVNTSSTKNLLNNITSNIPKEAFSITYKNTSYSLNNFNYNNHYLHSSLHLKNTLNLTLTCTQKYSENCLVFKLEITNLLKSNLLLSFNFNTSLSSQSLKNAVILQNKAKWYFYQENLLTPNNACFLTGKFSHIASNKHKLFAQKHFKILPFKTQVFYFSVSKQTQNFALTSLENLPKNLVDTSLSTKIKNHSNYILNNLQNLFEFNEYNKIKLPKVLTLNKTLNTLLNSFLPQKIIKNYIVNNFKNLHSQINLTCYEQDFLNLKNTTFNFSLINKSLVPNNLNSLFLLNNNLYKTYLNMFYFKIGIFPTSNKININPTTLLIENNAVVSVPSQETRVKITNTNLKNEVKINAISYTNLPFITLTSKTKNLHLQF